MSQWWKSRKYDNFLFTWSARNIPTRKDDRLLPIPFILWLLSEIGHCPFRAEGKSRKIVKEWTLEQPNLRRNNVWEERAKKTRVGIGVTGCWVQGERVKKMQCGRFGKYIWQIQKKYSWEKQLEHLCHWALGAGKGWRKCNSQWNVVKRNTFDK